MEDPHAEGHVGSVTKEEDPKPSHQLYKLQIKSTRSTRQTVSLEYIKGPTKETPTKENTLVLIIMDIGGKNTEEWDQIRI